MIEAPAGQQFLHNDVPFPWKLHHILEYTETSGLNGIVSWTPTRTGFKVHNPDAFDQHIMPLYFNQTKYKSFQRQLNIWGFYRTKAGPEKGSYTHPCFVRGMPELCQKMKRTKIKGIYSKRRCLTSGIAPAKSVPPTSSFASMMPSSSAPLPDVHTTLCEIQRALLACEKQQSEIKERFGVAIQSVTPIASSSCCDTNDDLEPSSFWEQKDDTLFEGRSFFIVSDSDNLGSFISLPSLMSDTDQSRSTSGHLRQNLSQGFAGEPSAPNSDRHVRHQLEPSAIDESREESLDEIWSALLEANQLVAKSVVSTNDVANDSGRHRRVSFLSTSIDDAVAGVTLRSSSSMIRHVSF